MVRRRLPRGDARLRRRGDAGPVPAARGAGGARLGPAPGLRPAIRRGVRGEGRGVSGAVPVEAERLEASGVRRVPGRRNAGRRGGRSGKTRPRPRVDLCGLLGPDEQDAANGGEGRAAVRLDRGRSGPADRSSVSRLAAHGRADGPVDPPLPRVGAGLRHDLEGDDPRGVRRRDYEPQRFRHDPGASARPEKRSGADQHERQVLAVQASPIASRPRRYDPSGGKTHMSPDGPCRREQAVARANRTIRNASTGARAGNEPGSRHVGGRNPAGPREDGPEVRPGWTRGRAPRPAGRPPPYAAPAT